MTFYVEEEVPLFGELTDSVNADGARQTMDGTEQNELTDSVNTDGARQTVGEAEQTKLTDMVNSSAGRFDIEELTGAVIEAVVRGEGCPHEVQLSILLVDEAAIQSLNKDLRGKDAVTDVLSFPACSFESAGNFNHVAKNAGCFDLDSQELILGDIVICVPRLYQQARSYGHSLKREYAFLLSHSLYHLLGYDHGDENAAGIMETKQEAVLSSLGIERHGY